MTDSYNPHDTARGRLGEQEAEHLTSGPSFDITVEEALATVPFSSARTQYLSDLYRGRPDDDHLYVQDVGRTGPGWTHYSWLGGIPGAVGVYHVASLFGRRHAEHLDAVDSGWAEWGRGVVADEVCHLADVFGENDHLTIIEQARRLDAYENWCHEVKGIKVRACVVLSGDTRPESIQTAGKEPWRIRPGKSLHAHFAIIWIDTADENAVAAWEECGTLWAAISMGDLAVRDVCRKSRLGGVLADGTDKDTGKTHYRIQTYLRRGGAPLDVVTLRDLMRAYAEHLGLDVEGRIRALEVARDAELAARSRDKAVERDELPDGYTPEKAAGEAARLREIKAAILDPAVEAVTDEQADEVASLPRWIRRAKKTSDGARKFTMGVVPWGKGGITEEVDFDQIALLDKDQTLLEAGEALGRGQHIWIRCPFHGDHDKSSKLRRGLDGRLRHRCWAGCETHVDVCRVDLSGVEMWDGSDSAEVGVTGQSVDHLHTASPVTEADAPKWWPGKVIRLREGAGLTPEGKIDAEWCRANIDAPVQVFKAGRSRGKTYYAAQLRKHVAGRVVGVAPIISLVSALASRLDLAHYLDPAMPRQGHLPVDLDLAVCAPSFWRATDYCIPLDPDEGVYVAPVEDRPTALLVADEIEQQLRGLRSKVIYSSDEAVRTYATFVSRLHRAECALLLDADIGPLTVSLLRDAGRLDDAVLVVGPGDPERKYVRLPRRTALYERMQRSVREGKRVAVACRSCDAAHDLARIAESWPAMKNKIIKLVTKETRDSYDLGDADSWAYADLLIYSPLIGTGLSIDRKWYDEMYLVLAQDVGTADDALQQAWRVRHLTSNTVYFWGPNGRGPGPDLTDPKKIKKAWLDAEAADLKRLGIDRPYPHESVVAPDPVTGEPGVRFDVMRYTRLMAAAVAWEHRRGRRWTADALEAVLRDEQGVEIEHKEADQKPSDAEKDIRGDLSDAAKARVKEDTDELEPVLASIEDVPESTLTRLRRDGPRNRSERLLRRADAVHRHYERNDRATIVYDNKGRGRKATRTYAHVLAALQGDVRNVDDLDCRELLDGVAPSRLSHYGIRARYLADALRHAGIDLPGILAQLDSVRGGGVTGQSVDHTSPGGPVTPHLTVYEHRGRRGIQLDQSKVARAARWAASKRRKLAKYGIRVREDAIKKPQVWLADVLRQIGLRKWSHQHRADGGQVRDYYFDLATLGLTHGFSTAYRRRLSHRIAELEHEVVGTEEAAFREALERQIETERRAAEIIEKAIAEYREVAA